MSIFDSLKQGFKNNWEKRKEEREMYERVKLEAEWERRKIFEEEYRKNAREVAIAKARKEAAELSGLQKLRATNRLRHLQDPSNTNPGSFFSKLSEYTQKNLAKTEERLKRTSEIREQAEKMKKERMDQIQMQREGRLNKVNNKPTWY